MKAIYGRMVKRADMLDEALDLSHAVQQLGPGRVADVQAFVRDESARRGINWLGRQGVERMLTHPRQGLMLTGASEPLASLVRPWGDYGEHYQRAGGALALGALGLGAYGVYRGGRALYDHFNQPADAPPR